MGRHVVELFCSLHDLVIVFFTAITCAAKGPGDCGGRNADLLGDFINACHKDTFFRTSLENLCDIETTISLTSRIIENLFKNTMQYHFPAHCSMLLVKMQRYSIDIFVAVLYDLKQ